MAASIWTGAIAFGLVNIPVQLETAVRSHDLSFRMLAKQPDGGLCPVKYERVCKKDGEEVAWDDIVKGYEYEKEKYVVLTDKDFDEAALATSKTFEIEDFTATEQIDPRFFEKPYYLLPKKGGERAYALLRDAMKNTGTLGIGRITMRKKQYLAAIKPLGDAIILDLMRFADEVLDEAEFRFPTADYRPKELSMAEELVRNHEGSFNPEKYGDDYLANLQKIIKAKMKGKKVTLKETEEPDMTDVIDLQQRLAESLEAKKKPAKKPAKRASSGTRKSA